MRIFPLRSSSVSLLTMIVTLLVASPRIVLPYEIGPKKKVHETLTLRASECLRRAPLGKGPSNCLPSPEAVINRKGLKKDDVDLGPLGAVSAKELAHAVRWPDDPTREVAFLTIIKFLVKVAGGQCTKRFNSGMNDGLLCSSHYGPLQFWHAMAANATEETVETERKMLAWADFLYDVVVNDPSLLDTDYCKHWKDQRTNVSTRGLAYALAPDNFFGCTTERPWTINDLFSLTCNDPFSSTNCHPSPDPRVARLNALGALLHMVQDSYAQGHAARGCCEVGAKSGRILSKFECLPITQFYSYSDQHPTRHNRADKYPRPARSCTSAVPVVDDPILASAHVLWIVQQKKGKDKLREYLTTRVFPLAANHQPIAGAGNCFGKECRDSQ